MDWFTSDTHFGHSMLIREDKRPFSTVEEMDQILIANWNRRVSPQDTVYHLGDFTLGRDHDKYLNQLNGNKILIIGNHDRKQALKVATGWSAIYPLLELKKDKRPIVLCHYAMRVWNRSHYGSLHLYGHSHGKLAPTTQSCDVGVDCWNFYPILLEEAIERMRLFENDVI